MISAIPGSWPPHVPIPHIEDGTQGYREEMLDPTLYPCPNGDQGYEEAAPDSTCKNGLVPSNSRLHISANNMMCVLRIPRLI